MDDQPQSTADDASFDRDAFETWVADVAEAKETSPQHVLDEMISSYWFLDEVGDMLEHSQLEASEIESLYERRERFGESADGAEAAAARGEPSDRVLDLIEILKDVKDGRQIGEQPGLDGNHGHPGSSGFEVAREIERLRRRLEESSERIEAVEWTAARNDRSTEELAAELATLRRTLEDANAVLGGETLPASLDQLAERLDEVETELTRGLGALERRLHTDAEQSAEILEHVLDQLDELEPQVAYLNAEFEHLQPVVDAHADLREVRELKRAANRAGIDSAICEACEDDVRIGLLERPRCPHCDRGLADVRTDTGWLRTTHYLTTGRIVPHRGDATGEGAETPDGPAGADPGTD